MDLEGILRLSTCDHGLVRPKFFSLERYPVLTTTYQSLLVCNLQHRLVSSLNIIKWHQFRRFGLHSPSIVVSSVIIYWIKLATVLVSAGIIRMMGTITSRIVQLVPGLVQFYYKLQLLPLVGRAHTVDSIYCSTSHSILRDQLSTVKELHS